MNSTEYHQLCMRKTLNDKDHIGNKDLSPRTELEEIFDYSFVHTTARIALYDDLKSAPRITEINPGPTQEFIENLASKTYEQMKLVGGSIPYTAIREVTENFIHAKFSEIIVSILNNGNTIRFSDQGPGIEAKEKAQLPGFTSAIEPMKSYIRGVGSGLPIVKEYLDFSDGSITIEDNLKSGAVVTINLASEDISQSSEGDSQESKSLPMPHLTEREKKFLILFSKEGALGVTEVSRITGAPQSSTYVALSHLEEYGLVEKTVGQKRILTNLGYTISQSL